MDDYCGCLTLEGVTLVPGRCPFCLGAPALSTLERLQEFSNRKSHRLHIEKHLSQIPGGSRVCCPHPNCDTRDLSLVALKEHFRQQHSIPAYKPKSRGEFPKAMEMEEHLKGGDSGLCPPEQCSDKRAPSSACSTDFENAPRPFAAMAFSNDIRQAPQPAWDAVIEESVEAGDDATSGIADTCAVNLDDMLQLGPLEGEGSDTVGKHQTDIYSPWQAYQEPNDADYRASGAYREYDYRNSGPQPRWEQADVDYPTSNRHCDGSAFISSWRHCNPNSIMLQPHPS